MKAVKLLIERYSHGEKQTIGNMFGLSEAGHVIFECDTLELPWLDNQKRISCIPKGKYILKKRYSKKYKNHLHVQNVENRSLILIHPGNYYTDILGCILVGKLGYVNNDDVIDVSSSKKTFNKLMSIADLSNNEIELEIVNR